MTLILSLTTPDCVVQVSDRRLTWINTSGVVGVKEDDRNKAVVVCNRAAVGYTGLAEISKQNTDEWLVNVLADVVPYNPQVAFKSIAAKATKEFRKQKLSLYYKRHAFVVVGWANVEPNGALWPYICAISNALDDRWNWLKQAQDDFRVRIVPFPKNGLFGFVDVGQRLNKEENGWLSRQLGQCIKRGATHPVSFIRLLAQCIRRVAVRNISVGNGLLAVSIPRAATSKPPALVTPLLPPYRNDEVLSLYYPPTQFQGSFRAPNYTCGGMTMWGIEFGVSSKPIEPPIEVPPWERGVLLLSKRLGSAKEQSGIRPQLHEDYDLGGMSVIGESDAWPDGSPSPCLMHIGFGTPKLSVIEKDERYLIVIRSPSRAREVPPVTWIDALSSWLIREGISPESASSLVQSLDGLDRGEITHRLRDFLRSSSKGRP